MMCVLIIVSFSYVTVHATEFQLKYIELSNNDYLTAIFDQVKALLNANRLILVT